MLTRLPNGQDMLTVSQEEVSHVDIYRALGVLEGKLDVINQNLTQKHIELGTATSRINELEKVVAKGLGMAIACSVVIPILVSALANRVYSAIPTHMIPPPTHQQR